MEMIPLNEMQTKILAEVKREQGGVCLFMTMGGGKTRTAIELTKKFKAKRILVLSLTTIIKNVWPAELDKWAKGNYEYANLAGAGSANILAYLAKPIKDNTIVGLNYDIFKSNTVTKGFPKRADVDNSPVLSALIDANWDVIILDESTKIKDPTSKTSLSVLNLAFNLPNAFVMSLSGTPNPETNLDLYTQVSVVDRGKRLGQSFNAFRDKYFMLPPYSFKWVPQTFSTGEIEKLIADISYIQTKSELEKTLPPLVYVNSEFTLSEAEASAYKQMVTNVIEMPFYEITAQNAGIVTMKLLQLSSGFVYDNEGLPVRFGRSKLDALLKLLDQLQGKIIVVYWFAESLAMIQEAFDVAGIKYVNAKNISEKEFGESDYKVLLLAPKANAYGGNWQYACNQTILYDLELSGERFEQLIKRTHRPGQTEITWVYALQAKKTHDARLLKKVIQKDIDAVAFLNEVKQIQLNL